MAFDKLSSEEINGLLGQNGTEGNTMSMNSLSKAEIEVVTELLSVSLGSSSAVLSELLTETIALTTPELQLKQKEDVLATIKSPFCVALGEFTGGIKGAQILAINNEDVQTIRELVDGEETENQLEAVQKVIQQMFIAVSQSMTTLLNQEIAYSLSGIDVVEKREDLSLEHFIEGDTFVEVTFQLNLGNQKNLSFHLCIPIQLVKQIVTIVNDSIGVNKPVETEEMESQSSSQSNHTQQTLNPGTKTNIQPVQFSSFDETASALMEPNNLDMLLDIPLQVTVELGRTKRMVKEILEVSQGSIIELDKLAGEPVDILINNKLIAVGEVVVIDENFGVRVTDILSTAERISKLR
ncbi:flagellar motor switch phosphatase FliY [Sporosarcina jiandibaonis]|uniref:flagellar motor switch phosphatase FliY n=1 Tax=Sporosarcina jiandibaonis TaxID=2715535 RepID=UPI001554B3C5|nr:flagellar motor switch phosphatase FliY [Sporosarcina jiandibaonis]